MSARAWQESEVGFVESQSIALREDIGNYPNTSELVFSLYPKQYYEASKQYEKFNASKKRNGSDNFEDALSIKKGEILKRRMEAERDVNEKNIHNMHGSPIAIGDEIQLFHVYSRSFLKATREKNFPITLATIIASTPNQTKNNPYPATAAGTHHGHPHAYPTGPLATSSLSASSNLIP